MLLPLGSIVYLADGNQKVVIIGCGMIVNQEGTDVVFDYTGSVFPDGLNPEEIYYFNKEDVDEVIFEGYRNDEEERYVKLYLQWLEENKEKVVKGRTKQYHFYTIIFTILASQNLLLEWMSTTDSLAEMVIASNLSVNKSESSDLLLFFIQLFQKKSLKMFLLFTLISNLQYNFFKKVR